MKIFQRRYMELRLQGSSHEDVLQLLRQEEEVRFQRAMRPIEEAVQSCHSQMEAHMKGWMEVLRSMSIDPEADAKVQELGHKLQSIAAEGERLQGSMRDAEGKLAQEVALRRTALAAIASVRAQIAANNTPPMLIPPGGTFHLWKH